MLTGIHITMLYRQIQEISTHLLYRSEVRYFSNKNGIIYTTLPPSLGTLAFKYIHMYQLAQYLIQKFWQEQECLKYQILSETRYHSCYNYGTKSFFGF